MTLEDAKKLLKSKDYSFEINEYENEAEFLKHIYLFPDTAEAGDCKVCTLVIPCKNEHKNIELQFNEINGEYIFIEMLFGDFCFEMYECPEEFLANELLNIIYQVVSEQIAIIVKNDIKRKRWIDDDCYVLSDDDPIFGEPGFFMALNRIQRPKNSFEKAVTSEKQYEIYSYSSYQCIIR